MVNQVLVLFILSGKTILKIHVGVKPPVLKNNRTDDRRTTHADVLTKLNETLTHNQQS
jgi:hypothetical protein